MPTTTKPKQNNTRVTANPHAIGTITDITGQVITVRFDAIPNNPSPLQGATLSFKVDTTARRFISTGVGTWVVASWGTSLRKDGDGNILVQGSVGNGAHLRSVENAVREPNLLGWLTLVRKDMQAVEDKKIKIEQGKQAALEHNRVLSLLNSATSGSIVSGPSLPWQSVPVPLPVMHEEWAFSDSYLRIGYVSFNLESPVEDIQVSEVSPNESISTIRSRTPIQKDNWHSQQQVVISFTCHGRDAQNQIILPILKMFRKTPLVPIFNTLLFEYDITALTLVDVQTSTIPGFPNSMKCVITALSFNWQAYMPTATEFSGYDWQVCYPLMKLWVEKPTNNKFNFHVPMGLRWDGFFRITHPDEDWLKATNEFGELAAKATRTNSDIDVATTAVNWRDAGISTPYTNFKVIPEVRGSNGPVLYMVGDIARVKSFNYGETVRLDVGIGVSLGNVGQFFPRTDAVTFLRIRSELVALQLTQSIDCVKIYKGAVQLETSSDDNYTPWNFTSPDSRSQSTYTAPTNLNTEVDKDDLRQLIGTDPATREEISHGRYVFVVNSDSKIFDNVTQWHKVPIDKDPRDTDPLPDFLDAFEPPSMVVEQISCEMQNIVASLQPRGLRTATHQYLGSNANVFTVIGTIKNQRDIGHIEQFLQTVGRLARQYKGRLDGAPFGGFVFVDNEFFQFMGTKTALITSFSTQTIPEFPGAVKFELQLIEFDPTQRQREVLTDLFKDYSDLPIDAAPSTDAADVADLRTPSQQDNFSVRYIRQKDFKNRLRKIELYPDMSLPTHSQLAKWIVDIQNNDIWDFDNNVAARDEYDYLDLEFGGTGWNWGAVQPILDNKGNTIADKLPDEFLQIGQNPDKPLPSTNPDRFADPVFFIAPTQTTGSDYVEQVMSQSKGRDIILSDPYGCSAKMNAGKRLTENDVISDPQNTVAKAKQAVESGRYPRPIGSKPGQNEDRQNNLQVSNQTTSISTNPNPNAFPIPPPTSKERPSKINNIDDQPLAQRIAVYGQAASNAAARYNIPVDLLFAHIEVESSWRANARSRTDARGLGQIEPQTGVGLGVPNPGDLFDPVTNAFATAKYISQLRSIFASHPNGERLAIAAYNAGPGAVKKAGYQVPNFTETQNYVLKVIQARAHYKATGENNTFGAGSSAVSSTKREATQLFKQFRDGYGYNLRDIFPFIITDPNNKNSRQVFQSKWFRRVLNTTQGNTYMVVWASFIPQFIEAKNKYKVFPPLVKIPEVLPGKNLYDHTASSVAADEKTIKEALSLGNIIAHPLQTLGKVPAVFAGAEAAFGTAAGGGSKLDQLHAEAEKIRQGVSASEVLRGAKEIVEFPLAIFGNEISQQAILDEEMAAAKSMNTAGPTYTPPHIEQVFHDPIQKDSKGRVIGGGHDIFHDMRKEMQIGSMITAFPTFYVAIVDGGRSLRVWRLFDHVYGMGAITRIAVHRTRKLPMETAVVGFSNMYGYLTSQAVEMDRIKSSDTRGIWNIEATSRAITNAVTPTFDAETIAMWGRQVNSLMLKPGARLHIRLGYGADASELPVVFNGVISEVPIQEGEVEVIALSDTVELCNDVAPNALQGSMPVTRLNSTFGEGLNPRELVMSYLAPNGILDSLGNLVGQHTAGIISTFSYSLIRNAYGIEHFGSPFRLGVRFDDGEIGVNIYDPEHSQPFTKTTAADSIARIFQPWKWDTASRLIGINMSNASPWQIFDEVRRTVPEYMLYTHPFELRSTLFMGKGWFPLFYQYKDGIDDSALQSNTLVDREVVMDWKPFQQCHIITSDWNLIGNMLVADASEVVTQVQAVGTYNGWLPGDSDLSLETSFLMMTDSDIFEEFQKVKIVESGLYTTVNMKLTEGFGNSAKNLQSGLNQVGSGIDNFNPLSVLAGVGGVIGGTFEALTGPFRSFFLSRRIMDYYATSVLRDHTKDMYQGSLVCLGAPHYKPYDFIGIADNLSGLAGLAEIKSCTHTLSLESGFVTEVNPDCCVRTYHDTDGTELAGWASVSTTHLLTSVATSRVIGNLARRVSPYFALRSLRRLQEFLKDEIVNAKNGFALGQSVDKVQAAKNDVDAAIRKVGIASKVKDAQKIRTALEELGLSKELKLIEDKIPFFIRAELLVQQVLRAVPGTKAGQTVASIVSSVDKGIRNKIFDLNNKVNNNAIQAETKLNTAQQTLNNFGKSDAEIEDIRKVIRTGGSAAQSLDQVLVAAIKEVDAAEGALNRAQLVGNALARIPATEKALKDVIKVATSDTVIGTIITLAVQTIVGGISDYVVRWAASRQCLTIYPLRIYRKELTAGINGHRGAVAGDDPGLLDTFMDTTISFFKTSWVSNMVPIISDLITADIHYSNPDNTPPFFKQ